MSNGMTERPVALWMVFDMSRGPIGNYVWWFETLEEAQDFVRNRRAIPGSAVCSRPVKYLLADPIGEWP